MTIAKSQGATVVTSVRIAAVILLACSCISAAAQGNAIPKALRPKLQAMVGECPDDASNSIDARFRTSRAYIDGKSSAVIIHARNSCLCGATGNCWFGIYIIRKGRAIPLLETDLVQTWSILSQRSKGYRDVRVSDHSSASEHGVRIYRFDGKQYRQHICEVWSSAEFEDSGSLRQLNPPKKTRVPCTNHGDQSAVPDGTRGFSPNHPGTYVPGYELPRFALVMTPAKRSDDQMIRWSDDPMGLVFHVR